MNPSPSASGAVHTNRLIDATSPYLLQHAHNPVDWYPWGDEALQRARDEDKPIFLSIGYAACHWCHVMERECFENAQIAAQLNDQFISIKVDREERPDLDEIYMNATLAYNRGQGGWPMSVFLTPDERPFFAGTYFPPESRWGRPGFPDVLTTIATIWQQERDKILASAESLTNAVQQLSTPIRPGGTIDPNLVTEVAHALASSFDRDTGGLVSGGANKFPPSMAMILMLREAFRNKTQPASGTAGKVNGSGQSLRAPVTLTLDKMAAGGIYDHLAGGIARYSTDPDWLVPHFEKMLYDQALVAAAYLEASQALDEPRYAAVARSIFDYVLDDLRDPRGGFYSSRDADSEGVEGKYYVWTKQDVMEVLGSEAGELFCAYYDVTDAGNWEGMNILHVPRDLAVVARERNVEPDALARALAAGRDKLLAQRQTRVPPGLDDKVLTGWNGLMIASLARGGALLDEPRYVEAATQAAEFILDNMSRDGRLLRSWRHDRAAIPAFLDDYAFFVEGLIDLYETTFDARWLNEALRLTEAMVEHFWDEGQGGFFFTGQDGDPLIVRSKDTRDGAIPSGNSVALMDLLRLSALLGRDDLRTKAERTMEAFAGMVAESPHGAERFLAAVAFAQALPREVVIVGDPAPSATAALIGAVRAAYDPFRVVMVVATHPGDRDALVSRSPLVEGKKPVDGAPTAYVCQGATCGPPITDPAELARVLDAAS